jgi:AmmeMemoRadiSam system protein B
MSAQHVLVRPPAVAGFFYPSDPGELAELINACFADAVRPAQGALAPKALVVPHAGYICSGPVAASGYLRLALVAATVRRVVLLGPSHRVPLRGVAVSSADAFVTPLGLVPVDGDARRAALRLPGVRTDDAPHAMEHSLEVQVPFLQSALDRFDLLPLAVGHVDTETVAGVIAALAGGAETLIVISSDLSHYQPYDVARQQDRRTAAAVVALDADRIGDLDACGAYALRGLLRWAWTQGMTVERLDVRNSGDAAGDRSRVVGYGSFAVH